MNISLMLKEIRENAGMSQSALAGKIGISQSALGYYERGERVMDIEVLNKLADLFSVSSDYLLGRTHVKKADNEPAMAFLGLSEEAIENIQACSKSGLDIDRLLTSPHFKELVSYLTAYWHCDDEIFLKEHYDSLGIEFEDYDQKKIVFILSRELNTILQQIVEDNRGSYKATQADIDAW